MDYKDLIYDLRRIALFSGTWSKTVLENAATTIETLLAEREARRGKWEYHLMPLALKCSRCKRLVTWKRKIDYNYCQYCGAKMDLQNGPTPPDRERTEG